MAYCDIAKVNSMGTLGGRVFDETTNPKASEVETYIDDYYDEINARLRFVDVTAPVDATTSPQAYRILARLNAVGAAGFAQQVGYMRQNPNESKASNKLLDLYAKLLELYTGDPQEPNKKPGTPQLLGDAVLGSKSPKRPIGSGLQSSIPVYATVQDIPRWETAANVYEEILERLWVGP
jgi:hypothetical protein